MNFARGGALCGARSALSARRAAAGRRARPRTQYSSGSRALLSLNLIYYLTAHCTPTYSVPHVKLTYLSLSSSLWQIAELNLRIRQAFGLLFGRELSFINSSDRKRLIRKSNLQRGNRKRIPCIFIAGL